MSGINDDLMNVHLPRVYEELYDVIKKNNEHISLAEAIGLLEILKADLTRRVYDE